MFRRVGTYTLFIAAAFVLAACEGDITGPVTGNDGNEQLGSEINGRDIISPESDYPTAKDLARYSDVINNSKTTKIRLYLPEPTASGSTAEYVTTVTPYADHDQFTVTVRLAMDVVQAHTIYIEMPGWGDGDPKPEFGFISIKHDGPNNIDLAEPCWVTTSGYFPWMSIDGPVDYFRLRTLTDGSLMYVDRGRLEHPSDTASLPIETVQAGNDKPDPVTADTVVYDEGDTDE